MKNVKILSTPGCPGCNTVKEMLEKLKKEIPMKIEVTDVTENPKILEKYPILSAPGIVIDGKLEFSGVPSEDELRKKLK